VLGYGLYPRYAGFVRNARYAKSMIAVLFAAFVCGCASTTTGPAATQSDAPKQTGTPLASPVTGGGERSTRTAWGVVRALSRTGFAATNPLDTTAHECPTAGCEQSVVTDQLRVKSFATPSQASRFASARGLDHVGTVVVAFAPPLSPSDREKYWAQIETLAGGGA
jgi:hypothetical protein